MIHILVPGRPLDWHMLARAQLQVIESINSILEVGSSATTAGFHDTDSGQCLFRNNVPEVSRLKKSVLVVSSEEIVRIINNLCSDGSINAVIVSGGAICLGYNFTGQESGSFNGFTQHFSARILLGSPDYGT
jgi:hypothetical protein